MPIYPYRCAGCGYEKDVLQKRQDAPLTDCPECGQARFERRLSAPAFQLKGSGWYVTDFRDGAKGKGKGSDEAKADGAKADGAKAGESRTGEASPAGTGNGGAAKADTGGVAKVPAPATTPAASGSGAASTGGNKAA